MEMDVRQVRGLMGENLEKMRGGILGKMTLGGVEELIGEELREVGKGN